MSHLDSETLLLIASHFPSELIPLTFQLRTLQDLLILGGVFIWEKQVKRKASVEAQHPSQEEEKIG
jgi:hypothetical protein